MLNQLSIEIKRSPVMALLVLLLLLLLFAALGLLQIQGLSQLTGLDLESVMKNMSENNTPSKRNFLRWTAIINQLSTFLLPALLFAYLAYQRDWVRFLRLHIPPRLLHINWGIWLLLFLMPVAQYAFHLNKQIPLPEWMSSMEEEVTSLVTGLLVMDTPAELLLNLLTIAVIPALAEEFLFRGVLQQKIAAFSRRPVLAIWVTAMIFSAFHGQFEGFLARLLLGAALGYLLYWTKNLWIPIIAHCVHNGLQVMGAYIYREQLDQLTPENSEPISIWIALLCAIFVLGIGRLLQAPKQV